MEACPERSARKSAESNGDLNRPRRPPHPSPNAPPRGHPLPRLPSIPIPHRRLPHRQEVLQRHHIQHLRARRPLCPLSLVLLGERAASGAHTRLGAQIEEATQFRVPRCQYRQPELGPHTVSTGGKAWPSRLPQPHVQVSGVQLPKDHGERLTAQPTTGALRSIWGIPIHANVTGEHALPRN
jgi:hypothetical protein